LQNFGINASIVSGFSDILWAVGSDDVSTASGGEGGVESGCAYHENRRGMRPVDWLSPDIAMMEDWKCN
jgi:hypothetical protein